MNGTLSHLFLSPPLFDLRHTQHNRLIPYHIVHMTTARLLYATQRLTCRASAGAFVFFTSKYAGTLHAFSVVSSFVFIILSTSGTKNLVIIFVTDN